MVSKQNRLAPLQVRVAGNNCVGILFRQRQQRVLHIQQTFVNGLRLGTTIEPRIKRDLIIPTSGRMKFRASITNFFR